MRKTFFTAIATTALLSLAVLQAPFASAATANGKCPTAGASAKIGGKNYVCAQNPTVKKVSLRWTLKDCLSANTAYLSSLKSFNETEASSQKVLATLDSSIKSLEAQIPIDKERAAKELASAAQNRAMAATRLADATARFDRAKAGGITSVSAAWTIQANAASADGNITTTEVATLSRQWGITQDQVALVFQFIAADKISKAAESYTKAAERNEKNAAEFSKTEQRVKDLTAQRDSTFQAQTALISIAKGDVSSTLKVRNVACRVKK